MCVRVRGRVRAWCVRGAYILCGMWETGQRGALASPLAAQSAARPPARGDGRESARQYRRGSAARLPRVPAAATWSQSEARTGACGVLCAVLVLICVFKKHCATLHT